MLRTLLPTPTDLPPDDVLVLRSNLVMHLLDGSFYVFGMSIVAIQTILPIFIREVGGDPLAIGSVQVLWWVGQNIPSLIVASRIRGRIHFMPTMVFWGFLHRLMLLICGIAAWFLIGRIPVTAAVPLFLLMIFLIPFFGGISGLPWLQVFTKTVPVPLRGRLMAIRQLTGSASGALGGAVVSVILAAVPFPGNFALMFVLAFVITMISFFFLTKLRERPSVPDAQPEERTTLVRDARAIIASDRNFRRFLVADAFSLMSLAAASFYSVYALERFQLPASYAGTFTAIVMGTNIVANIVFGAVADQYGHRVNMLVLAASSGLAAIVAFLASNILVYGLAFVFFATAVQMQAISRQPFIAEMCRENDRPMYVGIVNTLTAPTVVIGVLFGWLVPHIGYPWVFAAAALLAGISFLILYTGVTEPRTIRSRA